VAALHERLETWHEVASGRDQAHHALHHVSRAHRERAADRRDGRARPARRPQRVGVRDERLDRTVIERVRDEGDELRAQPRRAHANRRRGERALAQTIHRERVTPQRRRDPSDGFQSPPRIADACMNM